MTRSIAVEGGDVFIITDESDTLLRGALRAGVGFPHECGVGGCGACRFELVDGRVETLWAEAPGLSERDRRRGKRLACQSRALGDCTVRVRCSDDYRPVVPPRRRPVRLTGKRPLTADMTEFTLQGEDAAAFLPGQYALLSIPGVPGPRAYSMANAANADGLWRFIIRRVPGGRGTAALFDRLQPGDALELDGPYGHAHLRADSPRDIVCIAGGSGLAPMLAIAAAAARLEPRRSIRFFDGARTARDLCAAPFLAEVADHLSYTPVLSIPDTRWTGEAGFVHDAVARGLPPPFERYDFYFAGPPPMIDALQTLLMVERKVPFGQIHFDRFC